VSLPVWASPIGDQLLSIKRTLLSSGERLRLPCLTPVFPSSDDRCQRGASGMSSLPRWGLKFEAPAWKIVCILPSDLSNFFLLKSVRRFCRKVSKRWEWNVVAVQMGLQSEAGPYLKMLKRRRVVRCCLDNQLSHSTFPFLVTGVKEAVVDRCFRSVVIHTEAAPYLTDIDSRELYSSTVVRSKGLPAQFLIYPSLFDRCQRGESGTWLPLKWASNLRPALA
jgi:hypothetical protein